MEQKRDDKISANKAPAPNAKNQKKKNFATGAQKAAPVVKEEVVAKKEEVK